MCKVKKIYNVPVPVFGSTTLVLKTGAGADQKRPDPATLVLVSILPENRPDVSNVGPLGGTAEVDGVAVLWESLNSYC